MGIGNQASTNRGTGGGIHADGGSTVTVHQAVFIDQRAHRGGAFFADGGETVLKDCVFGGNRADQDGGALMLDQTMASVLECVFEGNEAETGRGGAVYADTLPYLFLVDSMLTENVASNSGGGLYAQDSLVRVYGIPPLGAPRAGWRSVFRGNAAHQGGGMELANCDSVVSHTWFESNNAPAYASGLYVAGGGTGMVWSCTIADNEGDGLRLYNGELWVTNSVVWGNGGNAANITTTGLDVAIVSSSDIGGGWPGTGNLDQDPMFSPTYHLLHGSPCIDAGVAPAGVYWPWDDADRDGESRPVGGGWDIGCDEFLDSDGDRMPDVAETGTGIYVDEMDLGTNPYDPDSDGDGVADGDEWEADTNPNDGSDFLRFVLLEPSASLPGGVDVRWVGGTNARQELDWAPRPDGPWQIVQGYPPPTLRTNAGEFAQAGVTGVYFRVRAFRP